MRIFSCLTAILALTTLSVAHAEALYLAGGEVSKNANYLYLGRIASLNHDSLQTGTAYRLWADQTKYQYDSNGVTHKATAYGIEGGLGTLFQGKLLSGSAFINIVGKNTTLLPDDPASDARGSDVTVKLQGDLNYQLSQRLSSNFGASYTLLNRGYWTRLRLMGNVSSTLALGLDLSRQGDADYSLEQAGIVLTGLQAGPIGIGIKAGTRKLKGETSSPYVGIELGANY